MNAALSTAGIVIEPLVWDSNFFGRKMGVLSGCLSSREALAAELDRAVADGFVYLLSRPPVADASAVRTLERLGFYLTDVGVTWISDVARYLNRVRSDGAELARIATTADVPTLARDAIEFFRQSRFYHDPFFSTEEADRLHAEWMANSVSGQAADAVWLIPETGFVTCKLSKDGLGDIMLIGVREGSRGRGGGRALMTAAMRWFQTRGVASVRVRTQMKNTRAMNFYHRLGFDLHMADMTMGCMLKDRGPMGGAL
jgi:GNAT superfamily N-acetyltransferase